jgi:hypothetical protein
MLDVGENCIMRSSKTITLQDETGRHMARIREKTNAYRILVGKPEGKSLLRRKYLDGCITFR